MAPPKPAGTGRHPKGCHNYHYRKVGTRPQICAAPRDRSLGGQPPANGHCHYTMSAFAGGKTWNTLLCILCGYIDPAVVVLIYGVHPPFTSPLRFFAPHNMMPPELQPCHPSLALKKVHHCSSKDYKTNKNHFVFMVFLKNRSGPISADDRFLIK
jgi:hypothetical protein